MDFSEYRWGDADGDIGTIEPPVDAAPYGIVATLGVNDEAVYLTKDQVLEVVDRLLSSIGANSRADS